MKREKAKWRQWNIEKREITGKKRVDEEEKYAGLKIYEIVSLDE